MRYIRALRILFLITPLILGSLASWQLLKQSDRQVLKLLTAISAFLAGLLRTVYAALKLDDHLEQCKHLAGEFKNLQDRFRQAALVSSQKPFVEFERDVTPLIDRLEKARSWSFTAPEWCFAAARKKIRKGDYDFNVDIKQFVETWLPTDLQEGYWPSRSLLSG